jgi:hypothetical protein
MPTMFIPVKTNLTEIEYQIVRRYAEEKGWGVEGLTTALRLIIREWDLIRSQPRTIIAGAEDTPAVQDE